MSDTNQTIKLIQKSGGRITRVREAIIDIIHKSASPISAPFISKKLKNVGITPNKTTVYRELSYLLDVGILREVNISQNIIHYEPTSLPHHHHLICSECGNIKEISCTELEKSIKNIEERVAEGGFSVKEHSLEFFGICNNCN